jgi:hypothetical protein
MIACSVRNCQHAATWRAPLSGWPLCPVHASVLDRLAERGGRLDRCERMPVQHGGVVQEGAGCANAIAELPTPRKRDPRAPRA